MCGSGIFLNRRIAQPIPDPGFGQKVLRLRRIFFNLFSQRFHVRAQIVKLGAILRSPDRTQQLGVSDEGPLMPHQECEQVELSRSEMDEFTIAVEQTAVEIKLKIAHPENQRFERIFNV